MNLDPKYLTFGGDHNQTSTRIVADSINEFGSRATTFVSKLPRIVLAELNTHKSIGKNSASSRAIPFEKMLASVDEEPFIPLAFQKGHSGMQGNEYFEGEELAELGHKWLDAGFAAKFMAQKLHDSGVTKQLCNRLLEPFLYHTAILTATDFENFFALRAHEAAEIHIQDLAYKMIDAYNESKPKELKAGEWHIPFGDQMPDVSEAEKIKIAVARVARVSYLNFDGSNDFEKDLKLHDRLVKMGHFSPTEHLAQASEERNPRLSGNLDSSWVQYRKLIPNENKRDPRVK